MSMFNRIVNEPHLVELDVGVIARRFGLSEIAAACNGNRIVPNDRLPNLKGKHSFFRVIHRTHASEQGSISNHNTEMSYQASLTREIAVMGRVEAGYLCSKTAMTRGRFALGIHGMHENSRINLELIGENNGNFPYFNTHLSSLYADEDNFGNSPSPDDLKGGWNGVFSFFGNFIETVQKGQIPITLSTKQPSIVMPPSLRLSQIDPRLISTNIPKRPKAVRPALELNA